MPQEQLTTSYIFIILHIENSNTIPFSEQVGNTVVARRDPGEYRKDDVTKDQRPSGILSVVKNPVDCHTGTEASKVG